MSEIAKVEGISWRKIIAQSAALAVHVGAFMFLLAPVKAPESKAEVEEDVVDVVFLEPPPPPPPPPTGERG